MSRSAGRGVSDAQGKGRRARRAAGARRGAASARPAALHPWPAVVLAVDTAALSGWSVWVSGRLERFGEADTLDAAALSEIVVWARWHAVEKRLGLAMVLEAAWGGTVPTLLALGAAAERWRVAWRAAGLGEAQVVKVQPSVWRRAVLGPEWASAPRAEVRAHEQAIASAMVRERVSADEAPAILIGRWAERAAAVGGVLRRR